MLAIITWYHPDTWGPQYQPSMNSISLESEIGAEARSSSKAEIEGMSERQKRYRLRRESKNLPDLINRYRIIL